VNRESGIGNRGKEGTVSPNYRRWLWIVLAVALIARLTAFMMVLSTPKQMAAGDGQFYHVLAKNILHGQYQIHLMGTADESLFENKFVTQKYIFSTAVKDQPTNFWSPGYPVFVAFWYAIFGPRIWVVLLVGCFLGAACCVPLYKIGEHLAGPVVGLLAALLVALHPIAIRSSVRQESETLVLLLFLTILYLVLIWRDEQGNVTLRRAVKLGLLLALTFYVRSTFVLLLGAVLLSIMWRPRKGNLLSAGVVAAVFLLLLLPWGLRNRASIGNFTFFETRGVNFLYGDFVTHFQIPNQFQEMTGQTELERWQEQKVFLTQAIKQRPGMLVDWALFNLNTWFPFHRIRTWLILADLLAVGIVLYGFYLYRRNWFAQLPVLLFIVFYYGVVLLLMKGYEYRFHLPTDILLSIFASAAILELGKKMLPRRFSTVLSGPAPPEPF
jgi:4-amino-4-deoxy-L-arabinose transferase-like glycosyltransferase